MKLRILGVIVCVASFVNVACEEKAPPVEEAAPPAAAEPPKAEPAAPADASAVCAILVEAANAKDMDKIIASSTPGAAEALAPEGLKEGVLAAFAQGTCGELKADAADANKAIVMVKTAAAEKEIPFVKGDAWRFDVATYLAKNAEAEGDAKNKKLKKGAKAKKAKKAKKG